MAEYYRILSYLYRYDKKKKMDCKGFIKAEQKRNGLKITLQIDDERLLEEIRLALCFYGKEENEKGETRWKMRQLAVLESSRHHEETVLFYPAEELPERFDIRKQYGVILFYQDAFFYGSVWIGDEIPVEALLAAYQEEVASENTEHSGNTQNISQEEEEALESRREPEAEGREIEATSESGQGPETEGREAKETSELRREPEAEERKAEATSESRPGSEIEEKAENPKFRREPDFERFPAENIQKEGQRIADEKENPDSERPEQNISTEMGDLLRNMWIDTEKKAKPVDNIFNPAFRSGYQISVEQLEDLSPEAEELSDNQFLAKGYAMYHHLLAGKVIYAGEERYCVGVPGIYENRERYMAQLYQFPVFLSLTENRIKTGGFGYWLHLLQE